MRKITLFVIGLLVLLTAPVHAAEDPVAGFAKKTVSYFSPVYGPILGVEGRSVSISPALGEKDLLKPGMRLKVMREGEPFRHPVTKEVLGKTEAAVGKVEVKEVRADSVVAAVIEGSAREGDKVRLSETKVRMLFCQDKGIDWALADDYYRKLKDSGRIEMLDTAIETNDEAVALAEAKRLGAEVALLLTIRPGDNATVLHERLYWVSDGTKFLEAEVAVSPEFTKDVKFGETFFTPRISDASMTFDLRFRARLIAAGDLDGDRTQEVLLSKGSGIQAYTLGVDLKELWDIKGSAQDDYLWLDTIDLNRNGRDEVVVTSMRGPDVESSIYEFSGEGFRLLWKGGYFVRRLGDGLIAQAYSSAEGFSSDIFRLVWDGDYRAGDKLRLPRGVNIYDFAVIEGLDKESLVFAYDEKGFLNLYDSKGIRVWRSGTDTGGFITSFKKPAAASYLDGGDWSIKDRLFQRQQEVMVVYRIPLADMVKTAGYKSSLIRTYWWNGVSMEAAVTIEGIRGSLQDYAVSGDKVYVLSTPFMGIKFGNILKGENPLGSLLSVYSIKGR